MDCYLCQDAGRKQVAHRILPGGKGICNDHFQGYVLTGAEPHVVIAGNPAPAADKEEIMARKDMDLPGFKRDYEAGMPGADLVAKYGIGENTLSYWAKKSGAKTRPRNTVGRQRRGSPDRRAAKQTPPSDGGMVTVHLSAAGLDRLWAALSLEFKADCINHILATEA